MVVPPLFSNDWSNSPAMLLKVSILPVDASVVQFSMQKLGQALKDPTPPLHQESDQVFVMGKGLDLSFIPCSTTFPLR